MDTMGSRWYRDERDLRRMLELVTASTRRDGLARGHLHAGDVVWGLFPNLTIDPTTRVRLFEDATGRLRGFAWLYPPREFMVQVDTTLPGAAGVLAAMIAWVGSHLAPAEPIPAQVASTDAPLAAALRDAGYRPSGDVKYQLNHQALGDDLPAPELPLGAEVRPVRVDDPAELEARVALHREVWASTKFTAPGYERLRAQPVYRPDLDLVAVTPEGALAAYCIVWWDPVTRAGLFEPVGAAVAHRRRGYAKALLRDALRRLRALGATDAIVVSETAPESEPARRLYASVGFEVVTRFEHWERAAADQA